jgi:hypothetical protein
VRAEGTVTDFRRWESPTVLDAVDGGEIGYSHAFLADEERVTVPYFQPGGQECLVCRRVKKRYGERVAEWV